MTQGETQGDIQAATQNSQKDIASWILTNNEPRAVVGRRPAAAIMKEYGKSYYLATKFMNPKKKNAIYNLYKLVRIPDLIVDAHQESKTNEQKSDELSRVHNHRLSISTQKLYSDIFFGEFAQIKDTMHLNNDYIESFWQAMKRDTVQNTYDTFEELCEYMYGSAEVVGLLMTQIIGYRDDKAIHHARLLGRAMQYANFLRDVKEDWIELGRIYLPQQDLARFGLTDNDIKTFCETDQVTDARKNYMRFAIDQCDTLYEESFPGIKYLSKFSRQGIYLAARLYQSILRKIEKVEYNIFAHSARTTSTEKFITLTRYLIDRSRLRK